VVNNTRLAADHRYYIIRW